MLQRTDRGLRFPLGAGLGIGGTGVDQLVHNTWSMNNLYQLWRDGLGATDQLGRDNVLSNDVTLGPGPVDPRRLRDRGRRIPNFNDDYRGAAPDIGAEELR
jgi:hypothetical protein